MLRECAALARDHGHRSVSELRELRGPAETAVRSFFDSAARADPQWSYAYSSRIPLAIPDYPDLVMIFLLHALEAVHPDAQVHTLVTDDWRSQLLSFMFEGGAPPDFRAPSRRGLARASRSLARHAFAPTPPRACDFVVFTLGDAVARGAPDSYFGALASTLAQHGSVLTVYAAPGTQLRFRGRTRAVPLETFLGPADPLRAWASSASVHRAQIARAPSALPPPPAQDAALIAYLRGCEHASGEVAMQRVMAQAFERMFAHLKPTAVVYPFENRSWEKHLLRAARRNGVTRCVGYQHSSLTPRHLAFSGAAGLTGLKDLPDAIVTCGEVTAERIRSEVPQARALVTAGAALRARRLDIAPPDKPGVLVPISSSRAEAWELLRAVHELARRVPVPVIVRTHPTIPIDDLYSQFDWPEHVRLSRGRALAEDLGAADVVVYSSSTVALEGLLYGRLPVFLDIGDIPSGNPLDANLDFALQASNADELVRAVESLRTRSADALARLREHGRTYAERYLVEPTPERIERIARLIAQC